MSPSAPEPIIHTEHLERFGAYEVPRQAYLEMLMVALDEPTRRGTWEFELDLDAFAETGGGGPGPGAEPEAELPTRTKRASQG